MLLLSLACHPVPEIDTAPPAPESTAVLASPTLDGDLYPRLLDAISGATQRIDVAQYTLYDSGAVTPLIDSLIDAAGRGIPVRVLADEAASGTEATLARLSAGGVDARLDAPSTTTHTKLLIADDYTFVGSHNWSTSAMAYNHEGSIMVWSPEVTAYYADFFAALWLDPASDPALSWSGGGPLTPLTNRAVYPALSSCLAQATQRIRVVMYAIADSPDYPDSEVAALVDGLIAATGRGVDVGVILDASDWIVDNAINDHAIERLRDGGVPIWRTPDSVTTHAKVLVCDEMVIISDANWSYSALTAYHGASLQAD
ncbi:MAG: phosphatidylserine/phosphatidylglycerophosphate/cardiolipin synthase-like enzyme, partial [Myxococcota bacterium]